MKRHKTILITGAGAPDIVSTINNLKSNGIRVIAADSDPLSVGLFSADRGYTIPSAGKRNFIDRLSDIAKKERVDIILPTVDEELTVLSKHKEAFSKIGVSVICSDNEIIKKTNDKWETYRFFVSHDFPTPSTWLPKDLANAKLGFPLIVKPRFSRGSRNVFRVNNKKELNFFCEYVDNPIIQEYVVGQEYTIDILSDMNGKAVIIVPRKRLQAAGVSVKGATENNQRLVEMSKDIVEALGVIGPSCLQCIVTEKSDINFIEANPRLAGSVALSVGAGINIPLEIVKIVDGGYVYSKPRIIDELTMLRYWSELFISKNEIKDVSGRNI